MKLLPRLILSSVLALGALLPLSAFEGKVTYDIVTGKDKQQFIYSLKGDRARIDMGVGMPMIVDGPNQRMLTIMPEQKMYMEISMKDTVEMGKKMSKQENMTFEDTGETEVILGRKCRKYRVTDRDGVSEIWGTEGMGKFAASFGGKPGKNAELPAWQRELAAREFFPLRTITRNKKGKEIFRMEATKIEEVSVPDSQLEVPAGYQKFDLGGMMKGLIPGNR